MNSVLQQTGCWTLTGHECNSKTTLILGVGRAPGKNKTLASEADDGQEVPQLNHSEDRKALSEMLSTLVKNSYSDPRRPGIQS